MTSTGAMLHRELAAAVVVVALTLLSSCGGADSTTDTASTPGATPSASLDADEPPAAELGVIDVDVAVRGVGAQSFVVATGGDPLLVGDSVRTDPVGFGEILYLDGSVTRVDVDSEVTVVSLETEAGEADVEIDLDVGRVWNRVRSLEGDERFAVATDVGTAAVRGTAFEVDCRPVFAGGCRFAVYDGTVEVAPAAGDPVLLTAFEFLEVGADGTVVEQGDIAPDLSAPTDGDGAWVRRNADLDEGRGDPALPIADEPPPSALALGVLYDCGDAGGGSTGYRRFFADGETIGVSSTGTADQVAVWFVAPAERAGSSNPDASYGIGRYELSGDTISGSETEGETVTFSGVVRADGSVELSTQSTNGFAGEETCVPVG